MKKRIVVVGIILLLIITGLLIVRFGKKAETAEKLIAVERGELKIIVEVNGSVHAEKRADMAFKIPGRLYTVPVETGDLVAEGQLLAAVDALDLQKSYEKSLEQYRISRYQFDQIQEDEYDDVPLDDTIRREQEKSQHRLNQAVDDVEITYWGLNSTTIHSPFSGVVTRVSKEEGTLAMPGEPVVTIQQTDRLNVLAEVPEKHIAKVALGDRVTLEFDAFANQTFTGTVAKIHPSETLISGNVMYLTEIESFELPPEVKPGMNLEATIHTDTRSALIVPYHVLRNVEGNTAEVLVYTAMRQEPEVRSVEIGDHGAGAVVEILSGVKEGEELVWQLD
ncbi:MAG: efflux RND transporter periplasmic adaptor subunit [Patescibacteria group bacterium]